MQTIPVLEINAPKRAHIVPQKYSQRARGRRLIPACTGLAVVRASETVEASARAVPCRSLRRWISRGYAPTAKLNFAPNCDFFETGFALPSLCPPALQAQKTVFSSEFRG